MRYLYLLIFSISILFAQGIHQFPNPCPCCDMFYPVRHIDTLYTFAGDTLDTLITSTDTVCFEDSLWVYDSVDSLWVNQHTICYTVYDSLYHIVENDTLLLGTWIDKIQSWLWGGM